jgi:hypothetical protein
MMAVQRTHETWEAREVLRKLEAGDVRFPSL